MRFLLILFAGVVFAEKVCFKDLNGNGNFDIGSNEIQLCDLGEDGKSYVCPIDRAECQLVGVCPTTCCWSGAPPVYNPQTGKCETDPGIQYGWAGRAIDPRNFNVDFEGYDTSRDCFFDAQGNCLTPTADFSVYLNEGDKYLPYLEFNRAGCVNTRAGIEIYVDGQYWDGWSVSQDPYCWGGKTFEFVANESKTYEFEFRLWGYTPEEDTQIAVRIQLSWYSAAESRWFVIGWFGYQYERTENNPYVYTYRIYLDRGDRLSISFQRHTAMFKGRIDAFIKYALVVTYPSGRSEFLGIKSCNRDWVAGWDTGCGHWGEFTATESGEYRFRWMIYVDAQNPSGFGDNTGILVRRGFPSCHWQYPFNPDTGKCEALPTKLDWTCPLGDYGCVKLSGTDKPVCSPHECINNPCQGALP